MSGGDRDGIIRVNGRIVIFYDHISLPVMAESWKIVTLMAKS